MQVLDAIFFQGKAILPAFVSSISRLFQVRVYFTKKEFVPKKQILFFQNRPILIKNAEISGTCPLCGHNYSPKFALQQLILFLKSILILKNYSSTYNVAS